MADWIGSLCDALEFVAACGAARARQPEGADRATRQITNPDSATTQDFVNHYGTAMLPARPRKPQDKAKVEVGVQIVERWVLARLRHYRLQSG